MAQEPENFEQALARLRQERAEDNRRTLAQSDVNRAAWLAQVEMQLARLRTPTERAKAYGAALFDQLAVYFRELIGHEPWASTTMGRVLRVDRPTKTCRVQIAADALNPAAVPGQRKVSYGFTAPRVGQTYPVHVPTRVTRSGPLQAEPDPEHLPWCKVSGGQRWLYRKMQGEVDMVRYPWPPPAADAPWEPELVKDLGTGHFLFGASTDDVSTDIVTMVYDGGSDYDVWENIDHPGVPDNWRIIHWPEMGFGEGKPFYYQEPRLTHPMGIANDGINTVAANAYGDHRMVPGSSDWEPFGPDEPVGAACECCHVCEAPPFGPVTICIGYQNTCPGWVHTVDYADQLFPIEFYSTIRLRTGILGNFSSVRSAPPTGAGVFTQANDPFTVRSFAVGCPGCGFIDACTLVWLGGGPGHEDHECHGPAGSNSYAFIPENARQFTRYPSWAACWNYDGAPAAAWVVRVVKADSDSLLPTEIYGNINGHGEGGWLFTSGCGPESVAPFRLPIQLTDGVPSSGMPDFNVLLALNPDTRQVILWASSQGADGSFRSKAGGSSFEHIAVRPHIISRDGTDVIGFDRTGTLVYSLDGGDEWAQLPTPTDGRGATPGSGGSFSGAYGDFWGLALLDQIL